MNNMKGNYFSGGFAEIVLNPSLLTYSYLKEWFTGESSLGKAMDILGLPYKRNKLPILELIDGELLVNLSNEEKTLYGHTIFKYLIQENWDNIPILSIDSLKLVNPLNWKDTLNILIKQSIWISNPQNVVNFSKELVNNIPEVVENTKDIEQILKDDIWPSLIAVGFLSEFFNQLIKQESKAGISEIYSYISAKQLTQDWYFLSISDQSMVKKGKLSFESYIKKYGKRADKDYELTCPRWYEIKGEIKGRIDEYSDNSSMQIADFNIYNKLSKNLQRYIDAFISLQVLRSEAKRKALLGIDLLRSKLKPGVGAERKVIRESKHSAIKGFGVSAGIVSGIAKQISKNSQQIQDNFICIFPNASTEFSVLYPKCKGIIFLKGGQTSHGSIVAREFGIPAIVDNNAKILEDGILITINGANGKLLVGKDIKK